LDRRTNILKVVVQNGARDRFFFSLRVNDVQQLNRAGGPTYLSCPGIQSGARDLALSLCFKPKNATYLVAPTFSATVLACKNSSK
jgi:hypothetical protein